MEDGCSYVYVTLYLCDTVSPLNKIKEEYYNSVIYIVFFLFCQEEAEQCLRRVQNGAACFYLLITWMR